MWTKIGNIFANVIIAISFIYSLVFSTAHQYDQATFFLVMGLGGLWLKDRYNEDVSR